LNSGSHSTGRGLLRGHGDRCRIADLDALVGRAFSVAPEAIRATRRGEAKAAFARQVAIYLTHIGFGLTLTEVAALFGRDRTTIAHACRVIERRREEPGIDATVGMLERALGVAYGNGCRP
jgi:chromosomal replication initiation ATPase DnaA